MGKLLHGTFMLFAIQSGFCDWATAPKQVNPNPGDQNPHYIGGGRRLVRMNGTTIALAPTAYRQEHMFRSSNNGATWTDIDPDGRYSGTLISGPDSLVFHLYADYPAGALKMVRFKYNADTIPAPTIVYANPALSQSSVLHEYRSVNAIVDSLGSIYVATHWGTPDRMYVFRSDDRGDTWSGPFPISSDMGRTWYYPHLEVDGRNTVMATYHENGNTENLMFAKSADRGRTWINRIVHTRSGSNYTANPSLLTAGPDTAYIFFQGTIGTKGVFVTRTQDGGATWGQIRMVEQTCGYGDPSPALGSDGTLYLAFRSDRNTGVSGSCGDGSRSKMARSLDKGVTWQAVDSLYPPAQRVGTKSNLRYQTWWNYGGPLEWIWMQYVPGGHPIFYDISTSVSIFDRNAGHSPPSGGVNRAPVIDSMTVDHNPVMRTDSTIWHVKARDPDNDSMTYQWFVDNALSGNKADFVYHVASCTPMSQAVEVRVSDGKGGVAVQRMTLIIQEPPQGSFAEGLGSSVSIANRGYPANFEIRQAIGPGGKPQPQLMLSLPGPVSPMAPKSGTWELRVLSAEGRTMFTRRLGDLPPGVHLLSFKPLQELPAGRFLGQMYGRDGNHSFPVIINK